MRPRVYHRYAATGKIRDIARGDGGLPGAGNGGDLAISETDRAACGAAFQKHLHKGLGGGAVKGQDAAGEILGEHGIYRGLHFMAPLARWQHGGTTAQFGLCNRAQIQFGGVLHGEPSQHGFGWCGAHKFRDQIGIQQDHARASIEVRRCRRGLSRRQVQINPAEHSEAAMDGLAEIDGGGRAANGLAEDIARLFFHGTAMFGSADFKATLQRLIKITDGNAGHAGALPDAIIVIIDCTAIKRGLGAFRLGRRRLTRRGFIGCPGDMAFAQQHLNARHRLAAGTKLAPSQGSR